MQWVVVSPPAFPAFDLEIDPYLLWANGPGSDDFLLPSEPQKIPFLERLLATKLAAFEAQQGLTSLKRAAYRKLTGRVPGGSPPFDPDEPYRTVFRDAPEVFALLADPTNADAIEVLGRLSLGPPLRAEAV